MEKLMPTNSAGLRRLIGQPLQDLPTPALLIDLPALKRNLDRMQNLVSSHGKALRPHVKTHKCSSLAQMQLQAGAVGVTCATVAEAEAMAAAGVRDILIANQLVTADKLERVAWLQAASDVKFAVDSLLGIELAELAARQHGVIFEVLVEVDTGGGRCGAQHPEEALILVQRVLASQQLRFGGIQAYNGGTSYIADLAARRLKVAESDERLAAFLEPIRPFTAIPRVSGAGAGNTLDHLQNGQLTEYQAGSYVYSDTTYRRLAPAYENALFVLCAVISRPRPERLIMDAGLKAIGTEFSTPEVLSYPNLTDCHFSEEHMTWHVEGGPVPQIGEKVLVIPSHCCTTVNLHQICFVVHDGRVVDIWQIDARERGAIG